jgi:hypothetical protein
MSDMREKENIMSDFERIILVLTDQDIPAAHDFLVNAFGFNSGACIESRKVSPSMARSVRVTPRFGFAA